MKGYVLAVALSLWTAAWAAPAPKCAGDCNGDGKVTQAELDVCKAVASGRTMVPYQKTCPACDANGDGKVDVGDILVVVNNFNNGCPK